MKKLLVSIILLVGIHLFAEEIRNNEVWYTTTDGTQKSFSGNWGANVISHTFENERWRVVFDGDVTTVPNRSFESDQKLKTITLPSSITAIQDYAFNNCRNLESVNFPDSLREIGKYAFKLVSFNKDLILPEKLETIGWGAFSNSHGVKKIIIPNSVISISECAFIIDSLRYLSIGKSVSTIKGSAFGLSTDYKPDLLDTIICFAPTPPYCEEGISGSVFSSRRSSIPLFVPRESVELYKTTHPWNKFQNNTYAIEGELGHDASIESITIAQQDDDALPIVTVTATDDKATTQVIQANEITQEATITVISEDGVTENTIAIKFVRQCDPPTSNQVVIKDFKPATSYDILGRQADNNSTEVRVEQNKKYIRR